MASNVAFPGFNTTNCQPLFFGVDGSTGCTLTKADIRPFTKDDFAAQDMKEVGMDRIIAGTKEARMIGVPQRSLMDLLLSRHAPIRTGSPGPDQSIVAPYRLVPRRTIVNLNYFLVTAGSATAPVDPATPFPSSLPATAYFLTVKISTGGFGSAVKNIERYFLPGMYSYVETTARHVGSDWQTFVGGGNIDSSVGPIGFRVVAAVGKAADADTAYVVVAPVDFQSYETSVSAWNTFKADTSGSPSPAQRVSATLVTKGTLLLGVNSVSDKEVWCYQQPALNNLGLIEYWRQTYRWTHQYNDAYIEALSAPLTSEFFKKFRTLPIAEQRRQQEQLMQQWLYNTVFYGQRISDKQTIATWNQLPAIDDLTNPGCTLEYKSNTLGIRTQLGECGKILDLNGGALNFDTLFELCYNLKRERGNDGTDVQVIDFMTDRFTKSKIRDMMVRYYKAKYGVDSLQINMQLGQKLVDSVTKRTVFDYDQFDLPDQGVSFSLFTDTYFDDRISASSSLGASSGTKNRARSLWAVDWSDILIGVHGNRSVTRQTNKADDIYNCVIDPNVNHYKLNSRTIEVQVGNTNRHLVIENFGDTCPTVTVPVCAPTLA
jgi:hypothetical protein